MESVEDLVLGEGVSSSGATTTEELREMADEHSWVQWYQKSWLEIQEAGDGRLVNPEENSSKFVRMYDQQPGVLSGRAVKKGLIRFMYVVIDFSLATRQNDYKPMRAEFFIFEVCEFISKFFASNPLSYVSLIVMRDGEAHFVTRMNGQPNIQIKKLKEFAHSHVPSGTCSLVKAFDLILRTASAASADSAQYASREVVVLWGSLASVDSVETPIAPYLEDRLNQSNMHVSILSVTPEVYAVKKLATAGNFNVALNATMFRTKLHELMVPRSNSSVKPLYIKMGFPVKHFDSAKVTKCSCHKELQSTVFVCPQCGASVCEIPTNCPVCRLVLADKDMLTRVHRLLYDMPRYDGIDEETIQKCNGCGSFFQQGGARCAECSEIFCFECDVFNHDSLRHCPGCLTISS